MSNQAHKNRTSPRKFDYPLAAFPKGFAFQETVNRKSFNKKRLQRMADFEARQAEKNPKLNPSGSAKFKGKGEYHEVLGVASMSGRNIEASPSASHAARLRGNKARGTQSSAARIPVK